MAKTYRVNESGPAYVADEDRVKAKLFPNGRSQAVRLPKEFRMPGDEVWLCREGDRVFIQPVLLDDVAAEQWLAELDSLAVRTMADPSGATVSDLMRELRDER